MARALQSHASLFTVATYDTSDNYLPQVEIKRDKYSSDAEWRWVPAKPAGTETWLAIQKLLKPTKNSAIRAVIELVAKLIKEEKIKNWLQKERQPEDRSDRVWGLVQPTSGQEPQEDAGPQRRQESAKKASPDIERRRCKSQATASRRGVSSSDEQELAGHVQWMCTDVMQ